MLSCLKRKNHTAEFPVVKRLSCDHFSSVTFCHKPTVVTLSQMGLITSGGRKNESCWPIRERIGVWISHPHVLAKSSSILPHIPLSLWQKALRGFKNSSITPVGKLLHSLKAVNIFIADTIEGVLWFFDQRENIRRKEEWQSKRKTGKI